MHVKFNKTTLMGFNKKTHQSKIIILKIMIADKTSLVIHYSWLNVGPAC